MGALATRSPRTILIPSTAMDRRAEAAMASGSQHRQGNQPPDRPRNVAVGADLIPSRPCELAHILKRPPRPYSVRSRRKQERKMVLFTRIASIPEAYTLALIMAAAFGLASIAEATQAIFLPASEHDRGDR